MYGHFSRCMARGELCDGVTHFPFFSLFFFFPERIPLTGNKYQDQTLPGKHLQEATLVPAAGCSGTAGAPAPGERWQELLPRTGRCPCVGAELLPGCRGAPASREPAAAGGRDAKSRLPLGCGDRRCVETNRQETVCGKAGEIIIFL